VQQQPVGAPEDDAHAKKRHEAGATGGEKRRGAHAPCARQPINRSAGQKEQNSDTGIDGGECRLNAESDTTQDLMAAERLHESQRPAETERVVAEDPGHPTHERTGQPIQIKRADPSSRDADDQSGRPEHTPPSISPRVKHGDAGPDIGPDGVHAARIVHRSQ
jgi:hypothetical protein